MGAITVAATILETEATLKGLSSRNGRPAGASPRVQARRRPGAEAM
jgi:hypothetical protein